MASDQPYLPAEPQDCQWRPAAGVYVRPHPMRPRVNPVWRMREALKRRLNRSPLSLRGWCVVGYLALFMSVTAIVVMALPLGRP